MQLIQVFNVELLVASSQVGKSCVGSTTNDGFLISAAGAADATRFGHGSETGLSVDEMEVTMEENAAARMETEDNLIPQLENLLTWKLCL